MLALDILGLKQRHCTTVLYTAVVVESLSHIQLFVTPLT